MSTKTTKNEPAKTAQDDFRGEAQARANYDSIIEMTRALNRETAAEDHAARLDYKTARAAAKECECQPENRTLEGLREAIAAHNANDRNDPVAGFEWDEDDARQRIQEDPLSIQVRSDWYNPGEEKPAPAEFEILLCTGGPAVRIRGELSEHGEPDRAWLEYQDWFTPWTQLHGVDQDPILTYCREFYYGEG